MPQAQLCSVASHKDDAIRQWTTPLVTVGCVGPAVGRNCGVARMSRAVAAKSASHRCEYSTYLQVECKVSCRFTQLLSCSFRITATARGANMDVGNSHDRCRCSSDNVACASFRSHHFASCPSLYRPGKSRLSARSDFGSQTAAGCIPLFEAGHSLQNPFPY